MGGFCRYLPEDQSASLSLSSLGEGFVYYARWVVFARTCSNFLLARSSFREFSFHLCRILDGVWPKWPISLVFSTNSPIGRCLQYQSYGVYASQTRVEFYVFTLRRGIYFHASRGGKVASKVATFGHVLAKSGQIRPDPARSGQVWPRIPYCTPSNNELSIRWVIKFPLLWE